MKTIRTFRPILIIIYHCRADTALIPVSYDFLQSRVAAGDKNPGELWNILLTASAQDRTGRPPSVFMPTGHGLWWQRNIHNADQERGERCFVWRSVSAGRQAGRCDSDVSGDASRDPTWLSSRLWLDRGWGLTCLISFPGDWRQAVCGQGLQGNAVEQPDSLTDWN